MEVYREEESAIIMLGSEKMPKCDVVDCREMERCHKRCKGLLRRYSIYFLQCRQCDVGSKYEERKGSGRWFGHQRASCHNEARRRESG